MSKHDRNAVAVLVLVGSLRTESVNRQLAQIAISQAPDGVDLELFGRLGELPFYDENIDVDPVPEPVRALREAAAQADATLVVTPEYNRNIPGALKNAIDWLSRPYGQGALTDKPAVVIGAAQGQSGGVRAHQETRKSLDVAGSRVVESITLSVSIASLGGKAPVERPELVARVRDIVSRLVAEVYGPAATRYTGARSAGAKLVHRTRC